MDHTCLYFAVPSKMSDVPFEPSRTSIVSLATYLHLENPELNERDRENVFDRMMTFMFSRFSHNTWAHSKMNRSIIGIPMLRPDSMVVHIWTLIITLVDLTYTAFLVPLSIAFDEIVPGSSLSWLTICDIVGTGFYIVDMIVEFHVGFIAAYDIRRKLVMRRGFIAENYIRRGGFVIDTISILSVGPELAGVLIDNASGQEYKILFFFRLIRLLRVFRLLAGASGIHFLASPVSAPILRIMNTATFFLIHVVFTMCVFINLLGCIWWFVAVIEGLENSWVPYAAVGFDLETANPPAQYTTSVYFAMTVITTVGFGDITPYTVAEMLVAMLFMACAVFYFGYIVNAVAQLSTMLSSKARGTQIVRQKLEEIDIWSSSRHIPESLRRQVKKYYLEVWAPHFGARMDDLSQFKELPAALRAELILSLAGDALKQSYTLSALDVDLMEFLATLGLPHPLVAGHDLYREGEKAEDFWVLQEGELTVMRGIRRVGVITGPAVIGQSGIFSNLLEDCQSRMHTMRASVNCTLWQFSGATFSRILLYRPKVLVRLALRYRDHLMHVQRKFGERAPYRVHRMIDKLGEICHLVANNQPLMGVNGRMVYVHNPEDGMVFDDNDAESTDLSETGSKSRDELFEARKLETMPSRIDAARQFAGEPSTTISNLDEMAISLPDMHEQDMTPCETTTGSLILSNMSKEIEYDL